MKKLTIFILIICMMFGCEKPEQYFNEWVTKSDATYYYDNSGNTIKNSIIEIDGEKYYFDSNGHMKTGIVDIDSTKYMFGEDGKLKRKEWVLYNNNYYRTDEEGKLIHGWFLDDRDGNWSYLATDGHMYNTQWAEIDGKKYYFDTHGSMVHDKSLDLDGKTYYFNSEGQAIENKGIWQKKFYVDDFGDYTTTPYVVNDPLFEGVFSNSATTNSDCKFKFLIDDEDVTLMMYEYNRSQVKGDEKYNCQLRASNGYEATFTGKMWSDRVEFDNMGKQAVLNCLRTGQDFKLRLKENTKYGTPSTYLFEAEADNFLYVYWK